MKIGFSFFSAACAALCGLFLSGCFNEPESAYRTVREEARVYLQDKGLKDLKGVADAFKAGDEIDYVNLDRNDLIVFPEELLALKGLKWLRLNCNHLTTLPDEVAGLTNLRRLYLTQNQFSEVPEALMRLPALTDVILAKNPISVVPDALAKKTGLEFVDLSFTNISHLPADLSAWKSLKALTLGGLNFTAEEMARIRKALPDTAVVF